MPSARQMFAAAALVTVMTSSATAQDSTSVCSCEASMRPGLKGAVTS